MACSKCGSDWTTKTGKDCASCPYCCKQQRTKARKQGRWSDECNGLRNCEVCLSGFSASSSRQKCCSVACRQSLRKMWLAKWKPQYSKDYSDGRLRGTQKPKRKSPMCRMCGVTFPRKGSKQYCSRKCFADARKCGVQSWDRTNQLQATYHRGGRWNNAPSKAYVISVGKLDAWLAKASGLCRKMLKIHQSQALCEVCGIACKDGASRFCSFTCNKAWRGERQCRCGITVCNATAFGPPPLCEECRRRSRRLQKRMYGCYRRRCRTYGGRYNPTVKPRDVFERDGWRCHVCKRKTHKVFSVHDPRSATIDHHPIPLSKGGDHDWHNVRCCCFECNSLKGAKWDGQRRLRMKS